MERRSFLKKTALGLGSIFLSTKLAAAKSSAEKPNILFLFADDQTHYALSAYGAQVQTPNLDKLVQNGVSFTNAYNMGSYSDAVCIASRTMLNTGRFVWNAQKLEATMATEKKNGRIWSQYFSKNGYDTYFAGKWHVRNSSPKQLFKYVGTIRPGMATDHFDWNDRDKHHLGYDRPVEGEPDEWSPYDTSLGGYWEGGKHWSEVLADESVAFLNAAKDREKPFFMYLASNAPHDPRQSPKEFVDMYPQETIKVPENFLPLYPYRDEIGCGYQLRDARLAPFPRTEYAIRVHRQEYFALITHLDVQIGRILDALEATGKADNTWIFYTADHGLSVGERGLMGKQNMFEESLKPPLIVVGPGVPKGKTIDTPVYLQDIMATTLELCGEGIPEHVQFKSLLPLINGERKTQYDAIYGAYYDLQRAVRKGDWKLIIYPKVPVTLLFNLKDDPLEMKNLADDPAYADVVEDMRAELEKLMQETGDELDLTSVQGYNDGQRPVEFVLEQNHPNPFNPETTIAFHLPKSADIDLAVFNIHGQKIRHMLSGRFPEGRHQTRWDGRDESGRVMPSGLYFYTLATAQQRQTFKMALVH